jgi:hypothetical protein
MPYYQIFDKKSNIIFEDSFLKLDVYIGSSGKLLLKILKENKYTIIDINGSEIIPAEFDEISVLYRGNAINYFAVEKNSRVGYINEIGGLIIDIEYEKEYNFTEFKNGLVLLKKGSQYYYINEYGETVLKIQAQKSFNFSNERALIKRNNFFGFINIKGEEVIECKFSNAFSFEEMGYARVNFNGNLGYIDKSGIFIVEPKFDSFDVLNDYTYNSDIKVFTPRIGKLFGIIAPALGKFDCICKYDKVHPLSEKYIAAKLEKKWGLIDLNDEILIPFDYDQIKIVQSLKRIFARKGKKWSVFAFESPSALLDKVDEWYEMKDSIVVKKKNRHYILYDVGEKEVSIDFVNTDIHSWYGDKSFFYYNKGNLKGIMSSDGEVIIESPYDEISKVRSWMPDTNMSKLLEVKSGSYKGVINIKQEIIIQPEFEDINYLGDFFIKKSNKKLGFQNLDGNYFTDCIYDKIDILGVTEVSYLVCSKAEASTTKTDYYLEIDKNQENDITIVLLSKHIGEYMYITALRPSYGGPNEVFAKIKNVKNWNITEGFFSDDLHRSHWLYYFNDELCENTNEPISQSDIDIFEKLNTEMYKHYIDYPDNEAENPVFKNEIVLKLKNKSYISSTATWVYKNLSKHWGLSYKW